MTTMSRITAGVDTHLDTHVFAALDPIGGVLGVQSFTADRPGYRAALGWLASFGEVHLVGVEGTGSYGAGLARFLLEHGVDVVEEAATAEVGFSKALRRSFAEKFHATAVIAVGAADHQKNRVIRPLLRLQIAATDPGAGQSRVTDDVPASGTSRVGRASLGT